MDTARLGKWIEQAFGARDERLFDLELETDRIERQEAELVREYERVQTEMDELNEKFQKTVVTAREAEDHELDQYKRKATKIKRNFSRKEGVRDKHGRRLTATLVVRSFQNVGDEEPEVIPGRIHSALDKSIIEKEDEDDYLAAVADALAVDERYIHGVEVSGMEWCPVDTTLDDDMVPLHKVTEGEQSVPELDLGELDLGLDEQ